MRVLLVSSASVGQLPSCAEKELAPGRLPASLNNNKQCLSVSERLVVFAYS